MTAVTYDMQKLDEAVASLAGLGTLQTRLQNALLPLTVLQSGGGMQNTKRANQLHVIVASLTSVPINTLSDDEAWSIAQKIAELQSANWHDAVWALEEGTVAKS
jgi:hypothetical protein